jgi:hypothetical protein
MYTKRPWPATQTKENKMHKFLEWVGVIIMGIIFGAMFAWGF